MALKAVVFDFDGTLAATNIDFAEMRRRAIDVLKRYGAWDPSLEEHGWTLEIIQAAAESLRAAGRDPAPIVAEAHREIERVELEACQRAELHDGAEETLRRLAEAGLAVGIITRNCEAGVRAIISRYELPVSVVLPREKAPAVKPDPRHLLAALEAIGAEPEEAAMVGDHITDVQCARAAGALAVAVAGASSSAEDLRQAGADYVASSLPEAGEFILSRR